MENAIASMPHNEVQTESRNIDVVTAEIKTICMQARCLALTYAIEVGRRLEEAKAMLPYGEWGIWLKERTEFSQSTANNLMRLYAEYGNEQIGLFGAEMNSETLGKLTYTKALKLLALPEEERESFVKDNDVENMSTRELDRAIKERDEALKKAEKTDELQEAFDTAKNKLSEMELSLANTKTRAEEARIEADHLSRQLEKAKAAEKKAKEQLKLLKENPTISDDAMAKIKAQAEADAAEAFKKQLADSKAEADAKLLKAQRDKETAEWERERTQAKLNDLQKQLEMSDPAVSAFRALFRQAQKSLLDLLNELENIKDEETKRKLTEATNALCKQYVREVDIDVK